MPYCWKPHVKAQRSLPKGNQSTSLRKDEVDLVPFACEDSTTDTASGFAIVLKDKTH